MYKIGVMGGRETVMGFKALGLEVYPVENAEEARRTFRDVTSGENQLAILYVEENLAEGLRHDIDKFKDVPPPPSSSSPAGTAPWVWACRPCRPRWSGPSAPTSYNSRRDWIFICFCRSFAAEKTP